MKWLQKFSRFQVILVGVAVAALAVWQITSWTARLTATQLQETAHARLALYDNSLHAALNRYSYLPYVLSRKTEILELLRDGDNPDDVSAYLEQVNVEAGAAALYLMDAKGDTIASSNWLDHNSYVGNNYSFRPYFQRAMRGHKGFFFGIGVTTGLPGLFLSHPIIVDSRIAGVAVAKIDLEPLQRNWQDGGETVFVSDDEGVIILSSHIDWRYKTLSPMSEPTIKHIRRIRQYEGADLSELDIRHGETGGEDTFAIGGSDYLVGRQHLSLSRWTLHFLTPTTLVKERQLGAAVIATFGMAFVLFGLLFLRERQLKKRSQRQAREGERFRELNIRLEQEVEERRRTEQELRDTQNDLVQAGKLAALGQMSAAIAHELNQPITAIRTFAASGELLLKRGAHTSLPDTFGQISALTERMGTITGQLKTFSRKSTGRLEDVDMASALNNALSLLEPQLRMDGCRLNRHVNGARLTVRGDTVRIEQVFINIIRNALDAMKDEPERELDITLKQEGEEALAILADSGTGLAPEVEAQLFDPFFTTKDPGQGVGLGLSVSYGIIRDLEGTIRGRNRKDGGAVFEIRLPLAHMHE